MTDENNDVDVDIPPSEHFEGKKPWFDWARKDRDPSVQTGAELKLSHDSKPPLTPARRRAMQKLKENVK